MKRILLISSIITSTVIYGQTIPTYYNDVDLSLAGIPLKTELSSKITTTHTNILSYSEARDVLKISDIGLTNNQNVWLIYGWNDSNSDITDDLNRDKDDFGGNTGQWNREHTFPKSLGSPNLGTSGPGADAHNLRASDVQRNGSRGNKKFAASAGQASGAIGSNWYPGDDWRGDAARIIMYMYLRYQNQCKPSAATVGNPVGIDLNMVDLLLTWNAEDPPGDFEDNRNEVIFQNQGNRNPFIDNPYLATLIWGGEPAINRWNLTLIEYHDKKSQISIYPNPSNIGNVTVETDFSLSDIESIEILKITGQAFGNVSIAIEDNEAYISNLSTGIYLLKIVKSTGILSRKIIIQ